MLQDFLQADLGQACLKKEEAIPSLGRTKYLLCLWVPGRTRARTVAFATRAERQRSRCSFSRSQGFCSGVSRIVVPSAPGLETMRVEYFFDVISPYSCFSWHVLRRYQSIWGIELVARPVFLGGIMQGTGNKPPAMLPARAVMQAADCARNAALFDVPLLPTPANFFTEVARTVLQCQRVLVAAQQLEKEGKVNIDMFALIDSLSEGVHLDKSKRTAENNLLIDDSFLASCCANAGIAEDVTQELLANRSSKDVKAALQKNTEDAIAAGAYGAPFMLIEGGQAPFDNQFAIFGSDRFEQIAYMCGKPWYGPQPSRRMGVKL